MLRSIIFLSVLVFALSSALSESCFALQSGKKLCVALADGKILARTRCRKTEKELTGSILNEAISISSDARGPAGAIGEAGPVGIQGPPGAQGPQGPAGSQKGAKGQIDLSGCRITESFTSNFLNTANPALYAEAFCNGATEFVLEDSADVSFLPASMGTKAVLQSRTGDITDVAGDRRPSSVGVSATRILSVGTGYYGLLVRAVCCPR